MNAGAAHFKNFVRDGLQSINAKFALGVHALDCTCAPWRKDAISADHFALRFVDYDQMLAVRVELIDIAAIVTVQIRAHLFAKHFVAQTLCGDYVGCA